MGMRWSVARVRDPVAKFVSLPRGEHVATLRLLAEVAVVEALLRVRPLPRVARVLGVVFMNDAPASPPAAPPDLTEHERRQLRCLRRVIRRWPFCAGTCLREALVAGRILRHRRPRLMIGVTRANGGYAAHAWLDVQGRTVGERGRFQRLEHAAHVP